MKKAESILIVLTVLSVFQSRANVSAVSPDGRNRFVACDAHLVELPLFDALRQRKSDGEK